MKRFTKLLFSYSCIFFVFAFSVIITKAAETRTPVLAASENNSEGSSTENNTTVSTEDNSEEPVHVLFIGNSFTASNGFNIGTLLEEIAASQGRNIDTRAIHHGGAQLLYYTSPSSKYAAYYKEVQLALLTESWDYIVLQENSKGCIENTTDNMFPAIEQLKRFINIYQPDAEILLYMTHGYADGTTTSLNGQDVLLSKSQLQQYTQMAYKYIGDKLELRTVPVGVAFARISKNYPDINLFQIISILIIQVFIWLPHAFTKQYMAKCQPTLPPYLTAARWMKKREAGCMLPQTVLLRLTPVHTL